LYMLTGHSDRLQHCGALRSAERFPSARHVLLMAGMYAFMHPYHQLSEVQALLWATVRASKEQVK